MSMVKRSAWSGLLGFGILGLFASFPACSGSVTDGGACNYAGKSYGVGERFPASDGCNECSCQAGGEIACTTKGCGPGPSPDGGTGCEFNGKRYAVGQKVPGVDSCNTCTCFAQGIACTAMACPDDAGTSCETIMSEVQRELEKVQACKTAGECGQVITGSSCGCTRDLVARKDADLSAYRSVRSKADELGCAGGSTCDCPDADGFACTNGLCGWNYVDPNPTCKQYDPGQLCVRGAPYPDAEILKAGEPLRITVRPKGCFSSSCSKFQEASCTIASGSGFEVKATFCVADTSKPGQGCTADCGSATAQCSFGQPLTNGDHKVSLGPLSVGFQVPSQLPPGGLCAGSPW